MAGYKIEAVVGKWEVQTVALIKGKLFCQGVTGCQLVSHLKQSPIRIQPNHLNIRQASSQQAGQTLADSTAVGPGFQLGHIFFGHAAVLV